jgi:hypothetical protein
MRDERLNFTSHQRELCTIFGSIASTPRSEVITLITMTSTVDPTARRARRSKQASSLSSMFSEEMALPQDPCEDVAPCDSNLKLDASPEFATAKVLSLKDLALRLRRAKRSLLLSAASTEQPVSPAESFRTIAFHLSDVDLGFERSEDFSHAGRMRARGGSVTSSGSK